MFVNPAQGDYRLLRGSRCVDAGDNSVVVADDSDILGKPRIMLGGKSETVDLGAYEYWFISATRQPGSANVELSWPTRSDKTYSVFFCDDLMTWQLANDGVPATGAMALWLDPVGWPPTIPKRFYRVMENE